MFGFGKSEKNTARADEGGANRLFLFVSDLGWRARIVDPSDPLKVEVRQGDAQGITQTGDARYEALVKLAVESIPSRDMKSVGEVRLLIDDPTVHYVDTRAQIFVAASVATLRDYGCQQLGAPRVTHGMAPFGKTAQGQRENGVAGFIDVRRASTYLTRMEKLAARVRSVTPIIDVMTRRAITRPGTYGGLYIGGFNSWLLIAAPEHGTLVARALPFGTLTLAAKLAEGSGVTPDEALKSLKSRDMLSEIRADATATREVTLVQSQGERILGKTWRAFATGVAETIEYFESQRVSGRPEALEVFGDIAQIKGLTQLLGKLAVPIETEGDAVDPLEEFITLHQKRLSETGGVPALNLLQHAGAELRIGTMAYGFRNDRLVSAQTINREEAAGRTADRERQQTRAATSGRRRGKTRGRTPDTGNAPGLSNLFGLLSRARGASDGNGDEDAKKKEKEEQQVLLLLVLLAVGALYWGYDQLTETRRVETIAVGGAQGKLNQVSDLRAKLGKDAQARLSAEFDADKVLWTEKFLLLAKAMNEKMWLSDLYLVAEKTGDAKKGGTTSKKLVIEGGVLPSTDGHILEIARYIQRLQTIDDGAFMADFKKIAFQGATIDQSGRDSVIRFGVEAWYDEAERTSVRKADGAGGLSPAGAAAAVDRRRAEEARRIEDLRSGK